MNNLKQIERLKKIHRLIKIENTGTPAELSKKLHISLRQTFLMLEQLKGFDAPLKFNRRTKTYYYEADFELSVHISIQVMSKEKVINVYAGKNFSNYLCLLQGKRSKQNYLRYLKRKLDVVG